MKKIWYQIGQYSYSIVHYNIVINGPNMFTIHIHLFNLSYSRGNPHIMWQQRDHGGPRPHMMWAGRTVYYFVSCLLRWSDQILKVLILIILATLLPEQFQEYTLISPHISYVFWRYGKMSKNKYPYFYATIYHTKIQNDPKTTTNCRLEGVNYGLHPSYYIVGSILYLICN